MPWGVGGVTAKIFHISRARFARLALKPAKDKLKKKARLEIMEAGKEMSSPWQDLGIATFPLPPKSSWEQM